MDVDKLRAKIRAANEAYWKKSNPIISDTEYDRLVENLRALSPNDPLLTEIGKENDGEDKVWHIKPLLSLDKRYSWKEMSFQVPYYRILICYHVLCRNYQQKLWLFSKYVMHFHEENVLF